MNDRLIINTSKKRTVKVVIQYVFRANFNDTYWLEEKTINLNELDREKLTWFDPYNGKSKQNATRVAVSYCSDEKIVILEESDGDTKEQTSERGIDCVVSEDYDENTFIAAHISMQ